MIADSIAAVLAMDWSVPMAPIEVERALAREGVLLKAVHPRFGKGGSVSWLWILRGSLEETGELLMLELTHGPYRTPRHQYPMNGACVGQRFWCLRGGVKFVGPDGVQEVRGGQDICHAPGTCHETVIEGMCIGLIHQPHGSVLVYA